MLCDVPKKIGAIVAIQIVPVGMLIDHVRSISETDKNGKQEKAWGESTQLGEHRSGMWCVLDDILVENEIEGRIWIRNLLQLGEKKLSSLTT